MSVIAALEPLVIPTYPVGKPEKNPVFFEKRVYQGSNGKVYPLPFIDKVYDEPIDTTYQSARLENDYIRLVMLPEIGGRIFMGQDKTNNDYDFFYRQDVIKPALVGLAGPWISGGVEFNWPQHHRPGTYLPADVSIEEEADGARTIWMSEHDPLQRLKGMHGIRIRPDSSLVELRARLYNRTSVTQTFLWWANVAAMVHDQYQSIFPPDVSYVADHAVRAITSFPEAQNPYYGVDYQNRPGSNDLRWYKNIPVPTSYMVCQTQASFFGGYDNRAGGGFLHIANPYVSPGKKQWTWGNHEFGWAWDRELTDVNGPYVELMAGVYTDNQPDFSYLAPYETKTFSQFWWPIQGIGMVHQASEKAALKMEVREDRVIELGVVVSSVLKGAKLLVCRGGQVLLEREIHLAPGQVWQDQSLRFEGEDASELSAVLLDASDECLLSYRPIKKESLKQDRDMATEPPAPEAIASSDELYFTGEHLEQYRHPTRSPELYWLEALKRDAGDARSNIGMGRRAYRQGRYADAETYFEAAIARLTRRHPNPETGEAHYYLGLTRVAQGRWEDAYGKFYKATWNDAWRRAAYYQLACLDIRKGQYGQAITHLQESWNHDGDHHKAMTMQAVLLRLLGKEESARLLLERVLEKDPLDHWARYESIHHGMLSEVEFLASTRNDAQTIMDLVFEYTDAGLTAEAGQLIALHLQHGSEEGATPNPMARTSMANYIQAWIHQDLAMLAQARHGSPDYMFPSRLHEQWVLEWAVAQPGDDPVAAYALGNFYYDHRRHVDAIAVWERGVAGGAGFATIYRNLGIAVWNLHRDGERARGYYLKAIELDANDPRLVSEYDQLRVKLNDPMEERLDFLQRHLDQVLVRDDSTVAIASLYQLLGDHQKALELITHRRFHPWEGGEGSVLRQFTSAMIGLGRQALVAGNGDEALSYFKGAMDTPESLGEAYHLLQAKADVNYWIGKSYQLLGNSELAAEAFEASAAEAGDFSEMAVTSYSPLSYYRGLSLRELGREEEAQQLFRDLKAHGQCKLQEKAVIDYFATSLPNLLVFEEDLQKRRDAENHLLIALAAYGLGEVELAKSSLEKTLEFSRVEPHAVDLARVLG